MKKIFIPFIITAVVVIAACSSQSGNRSIDPTLAAAVKAKIESKNYAVYVDRMLPNNGRSVSLNVPYNIKISGDSIYSYLPYFGEAYTAVVGRTEGLNFDSTVSDYTVKKGKKGSMDIKFSTRTFEDSYDYMLSVYPNGSTSLFVTPNRKSTVSFDGKLRLKD